MYCVKRCILGSFFLIIPVLHTRACGAAISKKSSHAFSVRENIEKVKPTVAPVLTPQDIESSCRGKGVRYVVLKASGGNIGTMRYRPGEAESFLSQYGHLGYWKKERVGDTLYYVLGN